MSSWLAGITGGVIKDTVIITIQQEFWYWRKMRTEIYKKGTGVVKCRPSLAGKFLII